MDCNNSNIFNTKSLSIINNKVKIFVLEFILDNEYVSIFGMELKRARVCFFIILVFLKYNTLESDLVLFNWAKILYV